jgi:light-regulated signal transduction histidine kinase (bacteriophytochrome)
VEATRAGTKQANEALERSNEELQQFAHIASHDLRPAAQYLWLRAAPEEYAGKLDAQADGHRRACGDRADAMRIRDILTYWRVTRSWPQPVAMVQHSTTPWFSPMSSIRRANHARRSLP